MIGKANVATSQSGRQLHGTEKKISGNVTNSRLYKIANVLEATLLSLLRGAILVYR